MGKNIKLGRVEEKKKGNMKAAGKNKKWSPFFYSIKAEGKIIKQGRIGYMRNFKYIIHVCYTEEHCFEKSLDSSAYIAD